MKKNDRSKQCAVCSLGQKGPLYGIVLVGIEQKIAILSIYDIFAGATRPSLLQGWLQCHCRQLSKRHLQQERTQVIRNTHCWGIYTTGKCLFEIFFVLIYIFRTRRRREIFQLKKTIRQLERKSEYHSEQVDYYHKYLKTCLANLQKNKGASSNKKQGGSRRGRSSGSDGRQVGSLTHFTFD